MIEPPELVLGHGASGSAASMAPWVRGLIGLGFGARAIDLPKGRAERAVPRFADLLAAAAVRPDGRADLAIGGHSFGGRVASLAAAAACADAPLGREAAPPAGLVLLSYPLHAPGRPEAWDERTAHWPALTAAGIPVLLLYGTSDPFVTPALMERALAERLPGAQVHVYPKLGHGLVPVLEDALNRVAAFLREIGAG